MTSSTAQLDPKQETTPTPLSDRELQVIDLVAAGQTNQEISVVLEISKRTVDNHISNILNKTNTYNRVGLLRWALQSGKVCIDQVNCCNIPITQAIKPNGSTSISGTDSNLSASLNYAIAEDGLERA